MGASGSRQQRIEDALRKRFAPAELTVEDQSARHAGHAGARPGGETHYHVRLRARSLDGMSILQMHRAVNEAVAAEFSSGLHALSLDVAANP